MNRCGNKGGRITKVTIAQPHKNPALCKLNPAAAAALGKKMFDVKNTPVAQTTADDGTIVS